MVVAVAARDWRLVVRDLEAVLGANRVMRRKEELLVEIAEGVKVRVVRSMITDVRAKTEPANTDSSDKKAASEEKK